jgi:release factor glutamine methyltransferase
VGKATFYTLSLATDPGRVMSLRPASEGLVAAAVAELEGRAARVVDVGTGSGALAVAIAAALPRAQVWATDTDPAAVALARANVRRHGLAGRVIVRRGDLLAPVPGRVDLIVANLPYLPRSAAAWYPDLADEPRTAVFTGGDGLGAYRRLVAAARTRLAPGGLLVIQLHRRVVAARADALDELAEELDSSALRLGAVA